MIFIAHTCGRSVQALISRNAHDVSYEFMAPALLKLVVVETVESVANRD